jgi:beta-lactam-binding protein with PASTA domain
VEETIYRRPPKSPVPAAVIASILTSIAVFFTLRVLEQRGALPAFLNGRSSGGAAAVEVPSILGMRTDQARELLRGRELLLSISTERDNAQYPAGTIAEQTPLPGSQIANGAAVQAVLSRGMKQIPVPKLAGLKVEDAVKQLTTLGLAAGPQKNVASDSVAAGTVVETEPAPGTLLTATGAVTLVVSSGGAAKPLPKVTGLRLRAARELLEQQGFKLGKIHYDTDGDLSTGLVMSQRPAAATVAPPGTPVELTVNAD